MGKLNSIIKFSYESEVELNFFGLFGNKNESSYGRPTAESYLEQMDKSKVHMLDRILKKLKFKHKHPIKVDLTTPMNVAGFYDLNSKEICLNPVYILTLSEKDIAHIIFHEGLHAGVFTNGVEVMDEVLVETLSKKKIKEEYGGEDFESGYDDMVDKMSKYFGNISYEKLVEVVENGDEETFNNLLEIILIEPLIEKADENDFTWDMIERELKNKWELLKHMFPRIINKIHKRDVGIHEDAHVSAADFKLEGMLEKIAERLIEEEPQILVSIFTKLAKWQNGILDKDSFKQFFFKQGYGYIIDFGEEKFDAYLDIFIQIFNSNLIASSEDSINIESEFLKNLKNS